jgi:putative FmdB family regulatory protein
MLPISFNKYQITEFAMPIYAFECDACGHQFDRLQKLSDADPTVCPHCGAEQVRRQLTAPSFRLAGAGWYETDFKKDGDKKRNLAGQAEPAAKPEPAAKSESASESKTPASENKPQAKPMGTGESKPAPPSSTSQ